MASRAPLDPRVERDAGLNPIGWLHLAVNQNHEVEDVCLIWYNRSDARASWSDYVGKD